MSEHYTVLREAPRPHERRYSRLDRIMQATAGVTIAIGTYAYWWSDVPGFGIIALAVGFGLTFSLRR